MRPARPDRAKRPRQGDTSPAAFLSVSQAGDAHLPDAGREHAAGAVIEAAGADLGGGFEWPAIERSGPER